MRSAFDVPTLLADPPEVSVADPDPDPDPDPVLELAWTVNGFTPSDPPVALETSRLNKPVLTWLRLKLSFVERRKSRYFIEFAELHLGNRTRRRHQLQ